MKYPLLKVKYLPNLYKHCEKIFVFHINLQNKGFLENGNKTSKIAYLQYLEDQIYTVIEQFYIINLSTRVSSNNMPFIIFKNSLPKKQLFQFIHILMSEIAMYTHDEVELSYHFLSALLFEQRKVVKITATTKAGDEILVSKQWEEQRTMFRKDNTPTRKYFKSYEQYSQIHPMIDKQEQEKAKTTTKDIDTDEEGYMYYI